MFAHPALTPLNSPELAICSASSPFTSTVCNSLSQSPWATVFYNHCVRQSDPPNFHTDCCNSLSPIAAPEPRSPAARQLPPSPLQMSPVGFGWKVLSRETPHTPVHPHTSCAHHMCMFDYRHLPTPSSPLQTTHSCKVASVKPALCTPALGTLFPHTLAVGMC